MKKNDEQNDGGRGAGKIEMGDGKGRRGIFRSDSIRSDFGLFVI